MMELRVENVTRKSKRVKQIYIDSFPKEERMPFWLMILMAKRKNTDFLAFYDKDILCGLSYIAIENGLAFIMFLAVDKTIRSKGYGSQILERIQSIYPNHKIIVSIEPCDPNVKDIQQRLKRKKFYIKNGYEETGYFIELEKIKQEILIKKGEFKPEEFTNFFKKYSNGSMNPKIWKTND